MTGIAHAADGAAQGGLAPFIPFVLIIVIFYFLLIRPQQKKAKEHQTFLANLQKGNAVVTSGGLHGKITGLTDTAVTLEIADNVRVKVARSHILGSISAVTAEAEKEAGKPAGG